MKVRVRINESILSRAAYVHRGFKVSDCAVALALKPLLSGVRVYSHHAIYHTKDGYTVSIPFPPSAIEFIKRFDKASPDERRHFDPISFVIDIPNKAIADIGEYKMDRILKSSHSVEHFDTEDYLVW